MSYLPTSAAAAQTSLVVRAHGDPDIAPAALARSPDPYRSQHGRHRHDADDGQDGDLLPADGVLDDARARRARVGADPVGLVQRAVVPRRATHQGDRHSHGAWRDHAKRGPAGVVTIDSSGRRRARDRRQHGRRAGRAVDGIARRAQSSARSSTCSIPWPTSSACCASCRRARWPRRFPRAARLTSIRPTRCGRSRTALHHGSVRLVKARPLSAAGVSPPVQIITPSLS